MEGVPSENRKVLASMNWQERLEDARVRRAENLRLQGKLDEAGRRPISAGGPPANSDEAIASPIEKITALPAIIEPEVEPEEPVVRRRFVGVAFAAGISVGVAAMLFQNFVLDRDPVVAELPAASVTEPAVPDVAAVTPAPTLPLVEDAPVEVEEASEVASVTEPAAPVVSEETPVAGTLEVSVPVVAELVADQAAVDGTGGIAVSAFAGPTTATEHRPLEQTLDPVSIALPEVGPGPVSIAVETSTPEQVQVALLESAIPPTSLSESVWRSGYGGDATNIPAQTDGLVGAATPEIGAIAVEGVAEAPSATVTTPVVDATIWIFAASGVGFDDLGATTRVIERNGLSVQSLNRVSYRISRNQVRYYDADMAETARLLADGIGATARDFTTANVNPPPGTLEIYLAGEANVARAPRAAPETQPTTAATELRNQLLGKIRAGLK